MHLPVALQKCQSRKINVLHKNHQPCSKRWHAKPVEIKCSLEVVVVEQIHHARQNKFQTISKNIILTVNVHKHILEKCCSPWKRSQPSTTSFQTWWHHAVFQKIPKTTICTSSVGETWWKQINTSASYLDTNSRVKCSMHSSPNIVTAHRVYPQTFIVRASTSSCPKDRNKQMPEKQNRLVLSVCPSSGMTSECLSSDSVSSSAEAKYDQYQSPWE